MRLASTGTNPGLFKMPKCTETYLKKPQICPIWGQSDSKWNQTWHLLHRCPPKSIKRQLHTLTECSRTGSQSLNWQTRDTRPINSFHGHPKYYDDRFMPRVGSGGCFFPLRRKDSEQSSLKQLIFLALITSYSLLLLNFS